MARSQSCPSAYLRPDSLSLHSGSVSSPQVFSHPVAHRENKVFPNCAASLPFLLCDLQLLFQPSVYFLQRKKEKKNT